MNREPGIGHEAIKASAGSGKTFQLATRYIRLLALDVAPDRICALTFSRLAAREIFDALAQRLYEAAGDAAQAAKTGALIGQPAYGPADFRRLLRVLLDSLHRLHVGTLDSFIVSVARAFPLELGVSVDFRVMDNGGVAATDLRNEALAFLFDRHAADEEARRVFLEAFKQATFGHEEKSLDRSLEGFVEDCRATYRLAPAAAAWGSVERIWPAGRPWPAGRADAPALAAATEVRLRASGLAEDAVGKLVEVVREAGAFTFTSLWPETFARVAWQRLIEALPLLGREAVELKIGRKSHTVSPALGSALCDLLEHVLGVETERARRQTEGLHRILSRYEAAYEAVARRSGRLAFDDVQALLTDRADGGRGAVISRRPGLEQRLYIDYRLDSRLDHWLLDEFQDTSDLQWAVLANLMDEVLQDDSGQRSFFYVGDVKQAIYGWRGGNARLFDRVLRQYAGRIDVRPLNVSFRSCPPVIETVNAVFGDLTALELPAGGVAQWQGVWQTHSCAPARAGQAGYVALLEPAAAADGESKPVASDRHAVVGRLLRELDPLARGLSVAVLVRTNEQGRALVNALREACPGLPVVHEGNAPITDCVAVGVLLALVRLAAHPGDTFAWQHVRMSPLGPALQEADAPVGRLPIVLLGQIQARGFQGFVREWAERLHQAQPLDAFAAGRVEGLVNAAGAFDETGSRDPGAFARFAAEYQVRETAPEQAVRVLTVHQSKGLGFDVVILPELQGSGLGGAKSVEYAVKRTDEEAAPEWVLKLPRRAVAEADPVLATELEAADAAACFAALCVLYVAMTRAKRALYLVTCPAGPSAEAMTEARLIKVQLGIADDAGGTVVPVGGGVVRRLYERGAAAWFTACRRVAPPREIAVPGPLATEGGAALHRPRLAPIEPSRREVFTGVAADYFEAETRDVMDFGTAIHALFEQIEWIETADPEALIAAWLKRSGDSEAVKTDVVGQFRHALEAPAVRAALARPAGNPEVWREKRFEIVLEGSRWVSGIFDRVTIERDAAGRAVRAAIVDYKSSRVDAGDRAGLCRKVEGYRPQMSLYAVVLARILALPLEAIALKLVFTRAGCVEDCPFSPPVM